jgi:glycosyltransferase involved in cell wall biosynthesis
VLFVSPWPRFIGPHQYLVELLRASPALASAAVVLAAENGAASAQFKALGCHVGSARWCRPLHPSLPDLAAAGLEAPPGLVRAVATLRSIRPDVVVTNTETVLLGALAARVLGLPHLQVFHAATFAERLGPRTTAGFARVVNGLNTRVVAVSEALGTVLHRAGVRNVEVVPNPIAVARLRAEAALPLPQDPWPAGARPRLVCAGKLSPMKGQDLLVEALPMVRAAFPRLHCLFVGGVGSSAGLDDTGQFVAALRARVATLGLDRNVGFLDEVDYLPALLASADLVVQPSRTESFGRVAAEALVCGRPVVGFDAGGLAEATGPGAVLVNAGDFAALGEAIVRLVCEEASRARLVEAGGRYVARFEAGRVAKAFATVLERVGSA